MCRPILCLIGLALCLTVVAAAVAAEAETDLQKLQGFWKVESFEPAQKEPDDPMAPPTMDLRAVLEIVKIEGNRIVSPWFELTGREIDFRLDPMQSPKAVEIGMRFSMAEMLRESVSATYSLEKDRLSILRADASGQAGLELTRLAADSHEAKLQGSWSLETCRFQGEDVTPAELTGADRRGGTPGIMIITGSWLILLPVSLDMRSDPKNVAGKFRLSPREEPNAVHVELLDPKTPMREWACIYALEDKTLKICGPNPFDRPKQAPARPRQMVAEEGDGQVLFTFHRFPIGARSNVDQAAKAQRRLQWIQRMHVRAPISRRKELNKLIRDYPGTQAAKDAKRLLGPDGYPWKRPREWTINQHRKVTAAFAGAAGSKVRLRTPDGQLIETTKEHLSEADRKWLNDLRRAR